jgi:uncharacterized protein YigE (DUF2233 family)
MNLENKEASLRTLFLFVLIILVGCSQPISLPITSPSNSTPTDSAWTSIHMGIEERTVTPGLNTFAQMVALRLDPTQVSFRVHYSPNNPLTTAEWRQVLPDALVIINANFFTPEYLALGLVVSDSVAYGTSYTDRGGMFSVQNGAPYVQSLIYEPYQGQPLEQAVQAFPMLVLDGQASYNETRAVRPSRRTVIGMDSQGHVIVMVSPGIGLGLYDLSQWLPTADLDLQRAFNLDGGGSTMMVIQPTDYRLLSIDPVPVVLAVYPK